MRESVVMGSLGDDSARIVRAAARNNAELCDLVSRAHGIPGTFAADAWTSSRRTPEYYPDAVTLDPSPDVDALLERIDASAGASIKDSFAAMDLAAASFRVLFSAEWIARAPAVTPRASVVADSGVRWSAVADAEALVAWEFAWSSDGVARGLFPPGLLDASELVVLRGDRDGTLVAGAVVNVSQRVVGVSNVFASTGDPVGTWAGCLAEVSDRFPELPIVGYESGAALDVARRVGFRPVGPLRVWMHE